MKTKGSLKLLNLKVILFGTCISISVLIVIIIRSSYISSSSSSPDKVNAPVNEDSSLIHECVKSCEKIPASLAHAIVHYTTSNTTPQQTFNEIFVTSKVLEQKSPCNFLVFGLGHDSLMWNALNHGGRTVFLDEDEAWIEQMSQRFPTLKSYKVSYNTKVNEANALMEHGLVNSACKQVNDPRNSACKLALKVLPTEVYETKWDLIMVDAPTGFHEAAPGRMTAIYTAGMLARNRESGGETDVFVHDVDRSVEDKFSMAFLCEGYFRKEEGRIRHFRIPGYKGDELEKHFCP